MNNQPTLGAVPPPIINDILPERPMGVVESLLKRPAQIIQLSRLDKNRCRLLWLAVALILGAAVYGVVMGSFTGGRQFWAAPVKLTAGLIISAAFCLPSLYMAACLSGRDVKVAEVAGYLLAAVALSALLLLGAAPAAWLFSVSTNSLAFMGALHLMIWIMATAAGLRLLGLALGGLRGHLLLWCLMFLLVCLQMSTVLRPLLGASDSFLTHEKKFFVEHWWNCL